MADIRTECELPATLFLHAQISALPLYLKAGFQVQGEEYLECGIPHMTMTCVIDRE
jgi:predicted GNAT family N-acyltransferase